MGPHTGQASWAPKKGACLPIFAVQYDGPKALCQSRAGTIFILYHFHV